MHVNTTSTHCRRDPGTQYISRERIWPPQPPCANEVSFLVDEKEVADACSGRSLRIVASKADGRVGWPGPGPSDIVNSRVDRGSAALESSKLKDQARRLFHDPGGVLARLQFPGHRLSQTRKALTRRVRDENVSLAWIFEGWGHARNEWTRRTAAELIRTRLHRAAWFCRIWGKYLKRWESHEARIESRTVTARETSEKPRVEMPDGWQEKKEIDDQ
ncbi:hypothetical protein B0H16DRAFT_1453639 [Mycena metata]|uniref:Uncharacterized protein n=1 Tax=Mycena metata TaxID=1033252 RepID=A0AAD7NMC1_9AGAR|nr:hypothetical protein B0H16DRAFT_1453639 [Mycena metata]